MLYQAPAIIVSALLFYLLAAFATTLLFPSYYRTRRNLVMRGAFSAGSFSINYIIAMAKKPSDMQEFFKTFYDMKYQNTIFIIKGIGAVIALMISTFLEKIVTQEKGLSRTDVQLLLVTGFLLALLIYLCLGLKKITMEYGETLKIYYAYRP